MCSRREVTISTKPVTSQQDRHLPLLGLRTCIHFQIVHVRQKGRKQKPLKKIPLPGEIPALKEAELGLLPKVIPTVTGNQSGQTTGHGHRLLTRKLSSALQLTWNQKTWLLSHTKRQKKPHQCSRSLCYRELVKYTSQMSLGRELSTALQRQEEKFPGSPNWGKKFLSFGLRLLFESPASQQGTPST